MIQSLLTRLFASTPTELPEPEARLAFAAMMVRIARSDGLYAVEEVERIDKNLMHHYKLDPFEAQHLRAAAEDLEIAAPDTVRFTRALKNATPLKDRAALVQSLWSIALADGHRDASEDQQLRLLANLLGLSDVESAMARQRAEQQ
jgi:uncharacterized tellurite resistance protein B-like protein